MQTKFKLPLLGLSSLLLLGVLMRTVQSVVVPATPSPDPLQLISLPSGETLPLAEVVELTQEPSLPASAVTEGADPSATNDRSLSRIELADERLHAGATEEALALYLSIKPSPWTLRDREYATAQRRIGWAIYGQSDPHMAKPYLRRSLMADPFDGNGWQDSGRVWVPAMKSIFDGKWN